MKIWKKSTSSSQSNTEKIVEKFTVGQDHMLDQRLVPYDVQASIAHAKGLEKISIITPQELETIEQGLVEILELWKKDQFKILPQDEDCHTSIENFLTEKHGQVGKRIHTGRSRNDQAVVAMRLYERENLNNIFCETKNLAQLLINFSKKYEFLPMPGFTHTQRAMLSSVGMWTGAIAEQLVWNLETLQHIKGLINRCPLGTAAGYGVNFDLPREFVSQALGFDAPVILSLTAQNTRVGLDIQVVNALKNVGTTLAHFANDLVFYSSAEFGFFTVDPALTTGSSIMPQKKNLDSAEIVRGEYAYICGYEQTLNLLERNLMSGYHREIGRTKEAVFGSFDKLFGMLEMSQTLIQNITPNEEKLREKCTPEIFAADATNQLVKEGMSFREAYQKVGQNLDKLEQVDIDQSLKSKKHLGATGNLGLEKLQQQLNNL